LERSLLNIHVVNLAVNVPGPVAAAMLRDMGARVTKVDPPGGDPLAEISAGWYADLVAGMDVRRIDLKSAGGRAELGGLLGSADLLLVATRPAALERLGLDWATLHQRYPRLSMVSIVGYPSPRQDIAGHDLTYQAEEGLVSPPALPRTFISDLSGAQRAVIASLALLIARTQVGEAGFEEVSLSRSARYFAQPASRGVTSENALLGGGLACYNVYPAREGWVAVAALEPHFRERLQQHMGVDVSNRNVLAFAFQERTAEEWQAWGEKLDLPIVALKGC
jgi:alpha-methylacyl-CoA racemase